MADAVPQVVEPVGGVPPLLVERAATRRVWLAIWVVVALVCAGVLFYFNPAQSTFYPQCAFHKLTGWQCPGCGGLRASHQLLHGHVLTALRYNAFAVVGLPVIAWLGWRHIRSGRCSTRWIWVMGLVLIVFGVVRNLPGFGWLNP